jgi:hypothetical protein
MQLTETSLEWAPVHLRKFYSSDFFPGPFEFQAVHTLEFGKRTPTCSADFVHEKMKVS